MYRVIASSLPEEFPFQLEYPKEKLPDILERNPYAFQANASNRTFADDFLRIVEKFGGCRITYSGCTDSYTSLYNNRTTMYIIPRESALEEIKEEIENINLPMRYISKAHIMDYNRCFNIYVDHWDERQSKTLKYHKLGSRKRVQSTIDITASIFSETSKYYVNGFRESKSYFISLLSGRISSQQFEDLTNGEEITVGDNTFYIEE